MQSPFKNKYFKKFAECRRRITIFCRLILEHLRNLAQASGDQAQDHLSLGCLGKAMLDFSQLPGITVLAEIELMFIAGKSPESKLIGVTNHAILKKRSRNHCTHIVVCRLFAGKESFGSDSGPD